MPECVVCQSKDVKLCAGCSQVYYCGVACQKKDWKTHKEDCFPMKIVVVEDRGRGMVATRDIKQGHLVVQDCAILTAEYETVTNPDNWESLVEAVAGLPGADQDRFFSLQPRLNKGQILQSRLIELGEEGERKGELFTAQIVLNNGIALADPGYNNDRVGIFPRLSFINHSCSPNAKWSQVEGNMERKEVRALTRIKKGEEITCSYFGDAEDMVFASREERQQFLESWNFECKCVLCSLNQEEFIKNESERKKLREISEMILNEKDNVRKARLSLEKLQGVKNMGAEMLSELSYTYQQVFMACWSTEEDDWRMKAELVRLEWKMWLTVFPLYSVKMSYKSVISE